MNQLKYKKKKKIFFSDLGLVPQYKETKRVKAPVSSTSAQKKPAPAAQSSSSQAAAAAVASRYSMDTLMDSNEVVGEAWGDSDDLPLGLPDADSSEGSSDSRKKKKPKPTGSKGKKKKGLLASNDSVAEGKKNALVSSVDDDMLPDLDNI